MIFRTWEIGVCIIGDQFYISFERRFRYVSIELCHLSLTVRETLTGNGGIRRSVGEKIKTDESLGREGRFSKWKIDAMFLSEIWRSNVSTLINEDHHQEKWGFRSVFEE